MTEVLEGEDNEQAYTDSHNDILTKRLKNSMPGSKGLPIGIQVVTPKWKDEQCLAVMQIIEEQFKYFKVPHYAQ